MLFSSFITTVCGQTFQIDKFEQLAVGIFQSENILKNQVEAPDTFAVYYTTSNKYLLEKTTFKPEDISLETSYQVLTETQAARYLANCLHDIS
ncbi:hypothetical protein HUW51_07450 [Adhaeribacter swui]|uniref:Uncharacterized protein n=1 Tax=Adhaeribacter swui TaxID=2086471 RepID=A0A7G7G5Y6_9BACT|nr:hypothetical protein [Adhaeribacter swui]QNF32570.1 hypothetical protein HUW51_07450 [Adhaeribacter swui]